MLPILHYADSVIYGNTSDLLMYYIIVFVDLCLGVLIEPCLMNESLELARPQVQKATSLVNIGQLLIPFS